MTDGQMFGELMQYKGATGTKDFANPDAGIEYLLSLIHISIRS